MAKPVKTLWHSELVELSPIAVTVLHEAQASKKNANNPDYVTLKINGGERYYNVENPACGEFFNGTKGQTFTLCAEGSREEAMITYVGEAAETATSRTKPAPKMPPKDTAPPARGTRPPARDEGSTHEEQSRQTQRPATRSPEQIAKDYQNAILSAKVFCGRQANMALIATSAAHYAADEFERTHPKSKMSDKQIEGIVMRMMIAADQNGITKALPPGPMEKYAAKPKEPAKTAEKKK